MGTDGPFSYYHFSGWHGDILRFDNIPQWGGIVPFAMIPLSFAIIQATPTFRVATQDDTRLIRISHGNLLYRAVGGCECCFATKDQLATRRAASSSGEAIEASGRGSLFDSAYPSSITTQRVGCGGVLIDIPYECVREIRLRAEDDFGHGVEDDRGDDDAGEEEDEIVEVIADVELLSFDGDHQPHSGTASFHATNAMRRERVRQRQLQTNLTWSVELIVLCPLTSPSMNGLEGDSRSEVYAGGDGADVGVSPSNSSRTHSVRASFRRSEQTFKIATFSLPTNEQSSHAQSRGGAQPTGGGVRAMNDARTASSVVLKYRQFCAARFPNCVVRPPWVADRPLAARSPLDAVRLVAPVVEATPVTT